MVTQTQKMVTPWHGPNLVTSQLHSGKPLLLQRAESRAQLAMPGPCIALKNERVMGDQGGPFHRGVADRCPYLQ